MEGHQSRLSQAKPSQEVSTTPPGKTKSRAEVDKLNLRRSKYCKIVLLIMEIAIAVIRKYITEQILNGNTFRSFLNEKTIKHALFHSVDRNQCCECSSKEFNSNNDFKKNPGYQKLWKLYISNPKNINEDHRKYKECLCKYAVEQTEIEVLDITMANCLIRVISTTDCTDVLQRITQIVAIRNEIFHLSELQDLKFETNWTAISAPIMGIANTIGKDNQYAQFVRLQIKELYNSTFKEVNASENGQLCIAYFNTKFDEFENNQDADSNRCKNLKLNILYDKLTATDMDKINNYMQTLEAKIDNTNIEIKVCGRSNLDQSNEEKFGGNDDIDVYIPVLLHLKLPPGWNINQIKDAVKKMKLQETSDMPINIKSISEDLTIVADVSSSSLRDNQELSSKIKQVIASIMSDTGINTLESAVIGIELDIPNYKVDDNTNLHFENVSEQTVKGETLQIEITFPEKFDIDRPRKKSAVDKTSGPHFFEKIVDCILINRQIVHTDYYNSKLLIRNLDGHKNSTIHLNGQPRYISIIRDDQIAISYIKPIALASGKVGNIDIIDIKTGLENTIENVWEVGCMTYQDEHLFVVIDGRKIVVMNLTGTIDRSFNCPSLNISNISSDKDLLYLTDSGMNKLFCCDIFGELKWEFKDDCLKMPSSVTVDPYHNVYVTGGGSKNVVIVSPDGKKFTELLPERIGVSLPIIIRYDKSNHYLVAFNYIRGDAFLLDKITSFTEPETTKYYIKEVVTLQCV